MLMDCSVMDAMYLLTDEGGKSAPDGVMLIYVAWGLGLSDLC